ncbi:MAG: phosphoenolpyruvate carboxykinase (ATP) [Anaerolineae bacterium]
MAGTKRASACAGNTFSTCFGAPFMVHHPWVCADLLQRKVGSATARPVADQHTRMESAAFGIGQRIGIRNYTRALLNAALSGALDGLPLHRPGLWL